MSIVTDLKTNFPLKAPARIAAIKLWWEAFKEAEDQIDTIFTDGTDFKLTEFMLECLDPVHPEIMWEFGPGKEKNHKLCIAAEGIET